MKRPPTSCDVTDVELLAYRDRELDPAAMARLDAHVAACPACQARLAAATATTARLRAASPLQDDPRRRARLQAALAGEPRRWRPPVALPGGARGRLLAALLVLVLVTGLSWRALRQPAFAPELPPAPSGPIITRFSGLPAMLAGAPFLCAPADDSGPPPPPGVQLRATAPESSQHAARPGNKLAAPAGGDQDDAGRLPNWSPARVNSPANTAPGAPVLNRPVAPSPTLAGGCAPGTNAQQLAGSSNRPGG